MTDTAAPAERPLILLTPERRRLATWVVLSAFFMDLLDTTIVNVAIPSIRADLGASYSSIQWIVAGYQLAFALFLITGGRLGDIFGYKTMFIAGMAGFTAASVVSGLAGSTEMLIGARFLQGAMAALMVPQILSTIQVMYAPAERRGVTAFYGALAGLASVLGPVLGALLISGNLGGLGWRTIFLVNLPVGIVAIIAAALVQPAAKSPQPLRLDLFGAALTVIAMLMLLFPLIEGRELDWPLWGYVSMAGSLVVFVLFGISQRAKERRDGSPLVVPSLFSVRAFVVGIAISGVFFGIVSSFFLTLTLFFQVGLGFGVLKAGLTGIPFSIGIGISAGLSGPVLVPRFGRVILTAGSLVMAAGLGFIAATAAWMGGSLDPYVLIPSLFISGLGMGMVVAPVVSFVLAGVPVRHAGSASGIISAVGQIGGATGVAIVGSLFFALIASGADSASDSVRDDLQTDLTALNISSFVQSQVLASFQTCFREASQQKNPGEVSDACRPETASAELAARGVEIDPAALGAALTKRGLEANQRNFTAAFIRTIEANIGGLLLVCLLTFFLPPFPVRLTEGAAAIA